MSSALGNFEQARMTPNDRVFLDSARARVFSSGSASFLTVFSTVYGYRYFANKNVLVKPKRNWPLPVFLGLLSTFPAMVFQGRSEYRRAIVDLEDRSYLRKFLFDAAIVANPDLNAQQLYSKIALEEYETHQRQLAQAQQSFHDRHLQELANQEEFLYKKDKFLQEHYHRKKGERPLTDRMKDREGKQISEEVMQRAEVNKQRKAAGLPPDETPYAQIKREQRRMSDEMFDRRSQERDARLAQLDAEAEQEELMLLAQEQQQEGGI